MVVEKNDADAFKKISVPVLLILIMKRIILRGDDTILLLLMGAYIRILRP
jgi:hypothetical protein